MSNRQQRRFRKAARKYAREGQFFARAVRMGVNPLLMLFHTSHMRDTLLASPAFRREYDATAPS